MTPRFSLRLRLFLLVLCPLILMTLPLGVWRYMVAQETAEELFDRGLLSAALAISRDVTVSDGDALLPSTRDLIRDASGGEVFYHATGPGGSYVTGYAYPPTTTAPSNDGINGQQFYEATYRSEPVRVMRITERVSIQGMSGDTIITVWQRIADRTAFANQLAIRAAILIGALLISVALVVWFGVRRGLAPLIELEDAIDRRSPDDLSQIKRHVPIEAQGIVKTLNRLFEQLEYNINAHQVFISDAAHQLRNPAAAVQSMAQALRDAPSEADRDIRLRELEAAARESVRISEQLLSLDRLQHGAQGREHETFDLCALTREVCTDMAQDVLGRGIDFGLEAPDQAIEITADRFYVSEALKNLIDNAMKHGGAALSSIQVDVASGDGTASITVRDDGVGLTPAQSDQAFGRFSQVAPSDGSGLGLAIVASVAEQHGGEVSIDPVEAGASLSLKLPLAT